MECFPPQISAGVSLGVLPDLEGLGLSLIPRDEGGSNSAGVSASLGETVVEPVAPLLKGDPRTILRRGSSQVGGRIPRWPRRRTAQHIRRSSWGRGCPRFQLGWWGRSAVASLWTWPNCCAIILKQSGGGVRQERPQGPHPSGGGKFQTF